LLESKSNIFVHGPNGSGKTSFVKDCIKSGNNLHVYVDCVEFYSEKLISISVSQQLNSLIVFHAKKLTQSKENPQGCLNKQQAKKFGFKICKNFFALLDGLKAYQ